VALAVEGGMDASVARHVDALFNEEP
jgi:hypothetical protein